MTTARSPRNVAAPPLPRASAGTAAPPHPRARVAAVDALRALALLAMIAYHFCYDLRYFGVLHADFEHDALWLGARALILGAFLAIAGASLVLAERAGQTPIEFWRHVGVIGACAAIVSAGFTAADEGKKLASTTYRLSWSHALHIGSSAEVAGCAPKHTVPH